MNATRSYPRPTNLPDPLPAQLILDASAGTGKTYALEHIVLDLLLRSYQDGTPLRIQQILVSTFTEKAAGEMRERIRALIDKLLRGGGAFEDAKEGSPCWILDENALRALDQARMDFDKATITTIHGFCQSLLRETAFLTGEPFETELVHGPSFFQRTIHDCIRQQWAIAGSPKETDIGRILEAFNTEEAFAKHLYLAGSLPGRRYPEPCESKGAAERLKSAYNRDEFKSILKEKDKDLSPQAISALLNSLDAATAGASGSDLELTRSSLAPVFNLKNKGPLALFKLAASKENSHPKIQAVCQALTELHASLPTFHGEAVDLFLEDACAYGEALKERERLLDFDDMARRLAKALKNPVVGARLGEVLRSRYKVVLLDEFQDTSPEQWQIFNTLFGNLGNIFLIGDPKQAIYGFRGGDVHTYLKAQESLRDQGAVTKSLVHNFRSTPSMINAYNTILDKDIEPSFFSGEINYLNPVCPGKDSLRWVDPGNPELELSPIRLVRAKLAGKQSLPTLRRDMARHLAWEVRTLLDRGLELWDDKAEDENERRSPLFEEDIFVLTRTLHESKVIHEALRDAGVSATFYKKDKVFQSDEATDLLNVLLAVADPGDASRRAKAFLTPAFGVYLSNLQGAKDLRDGHPLMETLRSWHELANNGEFGKLFRLIVDGGLLNRLLRQEQDDHSASIWLQLTDFMLEQCLARKGNFQEAVAYLADCIDKRVAPPDEDASLHRAATDQSAVQILTMHKAKGLEAKVVVLFGGLTPFPTEGIQRFAINGESRYWLGSNPSPGLNAWVQKELQEEGERLLYVALTRAKAQLILPVYVTDGGVECKKGLDSKTADPKGDYGVLNRRLRAILETGEHPHFEVVEMDASRRKPPPSKAMAHVGLSIPEPPDGSFWNDVSPPPSFESFTSLSKEIRESGRLDPEIRPETVITRGVPGGPLVGTCLHSILETVPLEGAAAASNLDDWLSLALVTEAVNTAMSENHLSNTHRRGIANLAFQTLRSSFILPNGLGRVDVAALRDFARELPFLMRRPGTDDYLDGSIDLLFEWEGRTFFVDWKSNPLKDYTSETCAEIMRSEYGLQFAIYSLAVCEFLGIKDEETYEARFGGGLYAFLRGMPEAGQACLRPPWSALKTWEKALEDGREETIHVCL